MYICANYIVSYAKFMDSAARSTDSCAIHGCLREVWIHRLRSVIHGLRRSTDCTQHLLRKTLTRWGKRNAKTPKRCCRNGIRTHIHPDGRTGSPVQRSQSLCGVKRCPALKVHKKKKNDTCVNTSILCLPLISYILYPQLP